MVSIARVMKLPGNQTFDSHRFQIYGRFPKGGIGQISSPSSVLLTTQQDPLMLIREIAFEESAA
jgi:hypothetical protein